LAVAENIAVDERKRVLVLLSDIYPRSKPTSNPTSR
jgi:hypothetical protein